MNKQHKKPRCDDMYRAILTLKTVDECKQFFDDLCTVTELQAMEQRYQVAQYLDAGLIYNDILEKTGASSATITPSSSMRLFVVDGSEPESSFSALPYCRIAPQPPGPGLPEHAPSV